MRPLVPAGAFHRARRRLQGPAVATHKVLRSDVPHPFLLYRQKPTRRCLHTSQPSLDVPTWPAPPIPQNPIGPSDNLSPTGPSPPADSQSFWRDWSHSASFQAALTTVVGLGMVFAAGVGYLEWYKSHVLHRVSRLLLKELQH